MEFIFTLFLILTLTKLAEGMAIRSGLPYVVGSLLIGIIIGPALLGWVQDSEGMHLFADIGVVLLMFLAGLESDVGILRKYFKPSLLVGTLSVIIPSLMFTIASLLFRFKLQSSIFIGLIFGATSLSIILQVLKELDFIKTREGSVVIGAVVLDDIIVIILLNTMLTFFSEDTSNLKIVTTLLLNIGFFIGVYLFARFILPSLIKVVKQMRAPQMITAFALAFCFGFSYLAHAIGISDIVGAFFFGLLLSMTSIGKEVEIQIEELTFALFAPVFFVSIGLKVTFVDLGNHLWLILIFTILAFASKYLAGFLGAKVIGFSNHSSAIIGASLISRGEMALILISLGLNNHLLTDSLYSSLVLVIIITTVVSPILLKKMITRKTLVE